MARFAPCTVSGLRCYVLSAMSGISDFIIREGLALDSIFLCQNVSQILTKIF